MDFDGTMMRYGAPALCGIKPASLFSMRIDVYEDGLKKIELWKMFCEKLGVFVIPIQKYDDRVLLFLYNRRQIALALGDKSIQDYLLCKEYPVYDGIEVIINTLMMRLLLAEQFPHEIGVFLGYPLEDVAEFEKNEGMGFKYSGYWKVYGNICEAKQQMTRYRECSDYCMRLVAGGMSVLSAAQKYRNMMTEV